MAITADSIKNIEILFENALSYFFPNLSNETVLNGLIVLENVRAIIRVKQLLRRPRKLLSEEGVAAPVFRIELEGESQWEARPHDEQTIKSFLKGPISRLTDKLVKVKSLVLEGQKKWFESSEKLPNSTTKLRFPKYIKLHPEKVEKAVSKRQLFSEMVFILRPIVYCYAIKVFGVKSWKPYFLSAIIDAVWLIIKLSHKGLSTLGNSEVQNRVTSALFNYLLRNPFFEVVLRDRLFTPVLTKTFGEGSVKEWILRLLDFKSSLAHTI